MTNVPFNSKVPKINLGDLRLGNEADQDTPPELCINRYHEINIREKTNRLPNLVTAVDQ